MKNKYKHLTRREFIQTSSVAAGGLAVSPGLMAAMGAAGIKGYPSAVNTKIGVKFVFNGVIHEGTYEGSCRVGALENLSQEAEEKRYVQGFEDFKKEISSRKFPPEVNLLEPVKMHQWIEKGNPEIMLADEEIEKLAGDDPQTDIYVVVRGGLPQHTCLRIAERFKKPVVLANTAGWGLDAPAGIRRLGLEGFYTRNWDETYDLFRIIAARKAIANTSLLNVTNFPDVVPRGVISSIIDLDHIKEKYGTGYRNVDYDEFFAETDRIAGNKSVQKEASKIADQLIAGAGSSNMSKEDVVSSVMFYLTAQRFYEKYGCNAFTIECFELCSSMEPWHRRFTPCLTHALMKDSGYPSACEKDLNALMAMAVSIYLSRKSAYMGNPDIDTGKNLLTLHHSDSGRKIEGIDKEPADYDIHSFTHEGFGATLRYDFGRHAGKTATLSRFDPSGNRLLAIKGTVMEGGGLSGYGCAQRVTLAVQDSGEILYQMQDFGHHLALVLGDYTGQIRQLGDLMGFEVVRV